MNYGGATLIQKYSGKDADPSRVHTFKTWQEAGLDPSYMSDTKLVDQPGGISISEGALRDLLVQQQLWHARKLAEQGRLNNGQMTQLTGLLKQYPEQTIKTGGGYQSGGDAVVNEPVLPRIPWNQRNQPERVNDIITFLGGA